MQTVPVVERDDIQGAARQSISPYEVPMGPFVADLLERALARGDRHAFSRWRFNEAWLACIDREELDPHSVVGERFRRSMDAFRSLERSVMSNATETVPEFWHQSTCA